MSIKKTENVSYKRLHSRLLETSIGKKGFNNSDLNHLKRHCITPAAISGVPFCVADPSLSTMFR